MITRRTKVQLIIFVLITLVGVSFVGARYARLDRLFYDDTYTVVAHFEESGGIFEGALVSWRGVSIGRVENMDVGTGGVDVELDIEKKYDRIPADTLAVVANRSAVGEQYVDLQPKTAEGPYLEDRSEIAREDTVTPLPTEQLLTDISTTVSSVDQDDLRTTVNEFGDAFNGTGESLGQIIDTSNSFIETANANFDVTTALIRDSNIVLTTQNDSATAIRDFSRNLALFSTTVAGSDKDIRAVIDNGSATANQLRTFLEDNKVDLAELINNLITTGEIVVKHLDGVEHMLVLYPYVVEGGYTVTAKDPVTGLYDAHFGMITVEEPHVCHRGYESTDTRIPQDGSNRPMNEQAHCAEPASVTNARGAQNAPRPVARYDSETGTVLWGPQAAPQEDTQSALAPKALAADSWKWLYLQPLIPTQE